MTATIATCAMLAVLTLGIGGFLTTIGPWYLGLDVPPWKPPNWAFGPVWSIIGASATAAAVLVWRAAASADQRVEVIVLFGINMVLNILWSLLFFRLKRPDWALLEVVPLWLSVAAPIVAFWPIRRSSSMLLLPYIVWLTIAAALNLSVVRRNAPFGQTLSTDHGR